MTSTRIFRSRQGLASAIAALLLACTGCADAPVERETAVGRQHRAYVDDARANWDGDAARPLSTTVWYPAAADSSESERRIGVFRFGSSAPDAGFLDDRRRALVLLSHGTGGSAAQLSWLAESLVQAGFIVAAVNHHGNTAAEDRHWPHGFVLPGERARDTGVLVDRLLADPELGPRIDPERIGVAGFSLGGYTALASVGAGIGFDDWQRRCWASPQQPSCSLPPEADFTLDTVRTLADSDPAFIAAIERSRQLTTDPRIRAVYAIAPALLALADPASLGTIHVPVRIVLAEQDQQIPFGDTAAVVAAHLPTAELVPLADAGHYVFLAPCTLRGRFTLAALCRDPAGVDRAAVHERIGRDAAGFFTTHLQPDTVQDTR